MDVSVDADSNDLRGTCLQLDFEKEHLVSFLPEGKESKQDCELMQKLKLTTEDADKVLMDLGREYDDNDDKDDVRVLLHSGGKDSFPESKLSVDVEEDGTEVCPLRGPYSSLELTFNPICFQQRFQL